ncbi:hypothetical protein KKF91_02875 [Myxococcota bacterium]|nr:hypothetical protein [Myxococcota bacterium]MBU1429483.1 hypothetical protein [Myxococcota bacterium]
MADPFITAISSLMARHAGIKAAIFADLDGESIALEPPSAKDSLILCAAYGGIALRRLALAEQRVGRAPVRQVQLNATEGSLLSYRVGDAYQLLLMLAPHSPTAHLNGDINEAIQSLEAQI